MSNTTTNLMDNKTGHQFNSKLANLSQGSCDNTPDTPDSLDSLVGSETDGVGAVHRDDDDDDPQLSITEPEASSQSLDAHSPLSPDRGIFSSLEGAQTTDITSDHLLLNTQCKNSSAKCQKECTIDPHSIVAHSPHSPKYTTSPFPSGLDENDSKSVTSSVTSLSCQQTAFLNTSTGNLSSCQVSQRDNLIEEVSTPVPTSQQRYLLESRASHSNISINSHEKADCSQNLPSSPNFNAELPVSWTENCNNTNLITDSFGQPLLSSSCSPTLGHSQQSTPTAARASSTSPTTSATPPLLSVNSKSEYAFENSSITTTNVELSNPTESEKLSQATPLGSTKSSIFSASPSSNFTSTLCAQSSSTTPICKLPYTTSVSIPSNCSSLVSSQTSFKQNVLMNDSSTLDQQSAYEFDQQNIWENQTVAQRPNEESVVKHMPRNYSLCQTHRPEPEFEGVYSSRASNPNNDGMKRLPRNNDPSPKALPTSKKEQPSNKYENRRQPSGSVNDYETSSKSRSQGSKSGAINPRPITKQPVKSSDLRFPSDNRSKRDIIVAFEEPVSKAATELDNQGNLPQFERVQNFTENLQSNHTNRIQIQGQNFGPKNTHISYRNAASSPKINSRNESMIGRAGNSKNSPHGERIQQQPKTYVTNQNMTNIHGDVGASGGSTGTFIIHPCKGETNHANPNQPEYYCQPQQPIYMAIIPTQGHPQMMQGNHPQHVHQPDQSPSCGYKNNHVGGTQKQPNVLASPTIISGLPFSGSPHYATLGRIAKDKVTGNMVFISCDASGNPHQAFIQGRSPVQLRASCSNPQLQTGCNVPIPPKKHMTRSMSQDQNHTNRNVSQPATPKMCHSPSMNRQQYTQAQLSPARLHQSRKENSQEVSSRYATIGRHNHKTYFNKNAQQVSSPQMKQLQLDLQATMKKRMDVKEKVESPPMKQSHVNKINARKVNHNLASHNYLPNLSSKEDRQNKFETRESLPLADVRKMATNVILQQPFPLSQTKPTQIVNEQPKSLDVTTLQTKQPLKSPYNLGRNVEPQCTDKDITTNESESESDQEEDEDDEDKIRRDASLPTILLPKPKRKPPFTIEGAMNSILKRNKKTEKENKLDNVRFQKDEEDLENEKNKDDSQQRDDVINEEKRFFSFFSNDNRNNNRHGNDDNSVQNCEYKKKRSSFSFTKLRVNLNKTNNPTVSSTDNENNNPCDDPDIEQVEKHDNNPKLDLLETGQYFGYDLSNASPRHHSHNKFESMEQRREARLMKYDNEGKIGAHNDSPHIDNSNGLKNNKELNGNVVLPPFKEELLKQEKIHASNSSTTSRESLEAQFNKQNNAQETFNNKISSRFKNRWRKSKKAAPPPPPPPTTTQENVSQVTNPTIHTLLPNGYAVGGGKGKQEGKNVHSNQHQKTGNSSTNEILLAGIEEASDQQSQRDITRLDSIDPPDAKNNYEIIGTRRDVLDEELLVDLRDLDQTKVNENKIPDDREPFPTSPLAEDRRQSKQVV